MWTWTSLLLVSGFSYPPPFTDIDPTVRNHDGFYLRMALGAGPVFSSEASGVGIPSELAFGETPAKGLVLGVGNYGVVIPKPETDRGAGQLAFNAWGPFVDYYFDPELGAHVQASVMFVFGLSSRKDDVEAAYGPGYGSMLGGGYEWWVAEQWSLGVLLRATYYSVTLKGQDSGTKLDVQGFVPSISFAATYH
jgi:hypothetical protein